MATSSMVILGTVFQLILSSCTAEIIYNAKFYNVRDYGAVPNGTVDNSEQFLRAWEDACQWNGNSTMVIPKGIYKLNPVEFTGPCKGRTAVWINGNLKASTHVSTETWISFIYVDWLVVEGGGTVDGQGASAWGRKGLRFIAMIFSFVKNARISHLNLINSQSVHLKVYRCENVLIRGLKIRAPGNSPNTDGMCIAASLHIQVENSTIASGDDCISMLNGAENVTISGVSCGPGHGISIGSLGMHYAGIKNGVTGLHVKNCTFSGTQNGLRIKTWAPSVSGLVSDILYEDIRIKNAANPIIVDQHYCPHVKCDKRAESSIQIKNVTYRNIWGKSNTRVAVNIQCSSKVPCSEFKLHDINLAYNGRDGTAKSECVNVHGHAYGQQHPPSCF